MPISEESRDKIIRAVAMAMPKPIVLEIAHNEGLKEDQVDAIIRQYSPDIKEIRVRTLAGAGLDTMFDDNAILVKTARFADFIEAAIIDAYQTNPARFPIIAKHLIPIWSDLIERIKTYGADEVYERLEARIILEKVQSASARDRDAIQSVLIDARDKANSGDTEGALKVVSGQ